MHEKDISRAIIESYTSDLCDSLECDVCIVGAGPSGLWLAKRLADAGLKTVLLEKRMSVGGGMWGGGMMYNKIVFQEAAVPIVKEAGLSPEEVLPGNFVVGSIECVAALTLAATRAGARILNLVSVEDLMVRDQRVTGVVINWTAVEMAQLHIDPMAITSDVVVDATGHPAEVAHLAAEKSGLKLNTDTGGVVGEWSMWAERAEEQVAEKSGEICPGLYVTGMAASAVRGGYRMGPIFGGMLLSAERVASLIIGSRGASEAD